MEFTVVIRGGTIIDGSGSPGRVADVGIRGNRIVAVGPLPAAVVDTTMDATGRVVTPGFIDGHVHSDAALWGGEDRFGSVLQGVTTHVTGADGFGWAPLARSEARALWRAFRFAYGEPEFEPDWPNVEAYLGSFAGRTPVNVVPMAPHQAIRFAVCGWEDRPATAPEVTRMADLLGSWLAAGAAGLSVGLDYHPGASATTDELVQLCRIVAAAGGVYAAHQRYSAAGRVGAWRETMEIGRRARVAVHVAHESIDEHTAPLLEEAARDADLTFDWYLYPAGSTQLMSLLPIEEQRGGPDGLRGRLADGAEQRRVGELLAARLEAGYAAGAHEAFAATRAGRQAGWSVAQFASDAGLTLSEACTRSLLEEPDALMVFHRGVPAAEFAETCLRTIRSPAFIVASDGIYHGDRPHPRAFGCFPRVLRWLVRELEAVSLEEAVHRMSGRAAQRYRLPDRGRIAEGMAADVVVFDPSAVADRATWDQPRLPPVGIDAVFVNGVLVVRDGAPTGALPGRVLRTRTMSSA